MPLVEGTLAHPYVLPALSRSAFRIELPPEVVKSTNDESTSTDALGRTESIGASRRMTASCPLVSL